MKKRVACQICGQEIAEYVCRKCGANVCGKCFNKRKGICTGCEFRS